MNHHESTKEERVSESSAMEVEVCDIVIETAVILEDSSEEELILDELRRLIQNRTAKNAFCSGVLFVGVLTGLMIGLGAISLLYLNARLVLLRTSTCMIWGILGLLTVTTMSIASTVRTLILNIFQASYESRTLGNESITHAVVSFVELKIVSGMVVGCTFPWVLCHLLSNRWHWMVLVTEAFPIGLILIHNSITDNRIMNGGADCTLELVKEVA
jgi:hypothetical protein